jgi:hypothetical protein
MQCKVLSHTGERMVGYCLPSRGWLYGPVRLTRFIDMALVVVASGTFLELPASTRQINSSANSKSRHIAEPTSSIRVPFVAMSVPRAILQRRFVQSRGFASRRATGLILRLPSTAAPQRQFISSARIQEQEAIQTPATGLTATRDGAAENKSHSIAITKLDRDTAPAEIQQLLRDAGVDV